MRCIGLTNKRARCKNNARFLFCRKHIFQPFIFGFTVLSVIGVFAGVYQDFFEPLRLFTKSTFSPAKKLKIAIQKDRVKQPTWYDSENIENLSDLITISDSQGLLQTYEFYHIAKSQKMNEYPTTSFSFDNAIPTLANSKVLDVDGDGDDEVLIWLQNKQYGMSLHSDGMISFIIVESDGKIAANAPMPSTYEDFEIENHNPYSAYQVAAVLLEKISKQRSPITYTNLCQVTSKNGKQFLVFGWVIDNSCFTCDHVLQVDIYEYDGGSLNIINNFPLFMYSGEITMEDGIWGFSINAKKPITEDDFWGFSRNTKEAMRFIEENSLPTFGETLRMLRQPVTE